MLLWNPLFQAQLIKYKYIHLKKKLLFGNTIASLSVTIEIPLLKSFIYKFTKGVSPNLWWGIHEITPTPIREIAEDNNTSINIKFNIYKNLIKWVAMSNLSTHQFDSHNLIFFGYRDFLARYGRNLCNGHR